MYPRNAASPEPIAIGPVVQISDGAVQTSGCTVRIKPIGVAEGDGGGTTAYSTDGIVLYTPTQAETNYTSFILIAKKTGCIPASITVVTTASATPGVAWADVRQLLGTAWLTPGTAGTPDVNAKLWNGLATVELPLVPTTAGRKLDVSAGGEAGVDWANVGSPTTVVDLSGTNIKTTQKVDVETIKTQTVTCGAGVTVSPYVGSTGAAINGTNANTLSGHDPGETIMGATDLDATLSTIAAYIDTEVAAIKAKTDNLPAAPAATGDIPTANQNADALLDRTAGVETNRTLRQALRLILATAVGKLSGAATNTVAIRDTNDSKDRVTATVDSDGNRSAVTLDAT